MRHRPQRVAARLTTIPRHELRSCSVVLAELLFGAEAAPDPATEIQRVRSFVGAFPSLPFDDGCARMFAIAGQALEARGKAIDGLDLMIASIALQHNLTLVTHNVRHFERVEGLRWEDWEQ